MLRQFLRALVPARNSLLRSPVSSSAGATGTGKQGTTKKLQGADIAKPETPASEKEQAQASEGGTLTAFERNSVTKEQKLAGILKESIPGITYISIQDISGGCGDMFEVNVEAKEFNGLSRVNQHRLVTDSLKTEIAQMHGIRINTKSPPPEPPTPTK